VIFGPPGGVSFFGSQPSAVVSFHARIPSGNAIFVLK